MIRVAHIATVDITHRYLLVAQLRRLRDAGFDVTSVSAPGPFVAEIEAEGIRHLAWHHATRSWEPGEDTRAFLELLNILRRERFDVVHTHTPKAGVMGAIAARMAGTHAIINTVHGYYATPDDPISRRLPVVAAEWIAARCSDMELFQSEEDLVWARRARIAPASRTRYLGNGADLARFDPARLAGAPLAELRAELGIPADSLVIGAVGRVVAEKGYHELFEAADLLHREFPQLRLLVVGPAGPAKGDALSPEQLQQLPGWIIYAGFREDVPELLSLMDVFVHASWREGLPRSAVEAAAMARPLVLTDIRGCREVARNGIEGLLVPVRDPGKLANAIGSLLRDPAARAAMGKRAREHAVERFDERRVCDVVLAVTCELASRGATVRRSLDLEGLRSVTLRRARPSDAHTIATMHATVLPSGSLRLLGRGFLEELFRAQILDPTAVVVVAERNGEVIGYSSGVLSMPAFRRRFVVRHGIRALVRAAPRLRHPGTVRRLLETARYPDTTSGLPDAEHAFLGVKRGTAPGLGIELTREVVDALGRLGADEVKGFVSAENKPMLSMLRRVGFEVRSDLALHDGHPSHVVVKRCLLPSQSSSLSS